MTRYPAPPAEQPRIDRRLIPSGLAGTRQTAAHVARLIREGAGDFYVRQKAIDILLARRVPPKDYLGEIDALFRWVQRYVRYTKDPFRIEVLHTPRRMLELRAGDCDDMTILLGALVKSVGHPVRIVLTGPDARRPDLFSHIYLEAQHHGDWIPLDATMPYPMGWSPRAPVRLVLSIEEEPTHVHRTNRASVAGGPASTGGTAAARSASASGAAASRAGTCAGSAGRAGAGARMAPPPVAPHPARRGRGEGSPREGNVGSLEATQSPPAERLALGSAAAHLARGTRPAAAPADGAPDGRAAHGVGRAEAANAAPVLATRVPAARGASLTAAPSSGDAAARRHCASTAVDAADTAATPRADAAPDGAATPGATRQTLTGAVEDASALYRRFTQLPASSMQRVAHPRIVPPVVVDLGELVAVVYRSDKWVGHPRTYIHRMEDPPRLVSDVDGRRLFVVGGNYRVTARGIEG